MPIKTNQYILISLLSFVFIVFLVSSAVLFRVKTREIVPLLEITIPKDSTANTVADILASKGIISNQFEFKFAIRILNASSSLKAGIYNLSPNMPLIKIVLMLKNGEFYNVPVKLVVPEGFSIYAISKLLEKNDIDGGLSFYYKNTESGITSALEAKYPFVKTIKTRSLEGYLFPDTYLISPMSSDETIVEIMLDRFNQMVIPIWNKRSPNNLSLNEIITLASIIEKEAHIQKERPIIASVFYNRLAKGIALGADPTIKYALENPKKTVYLKDLKVNSAYNTYTNRGLPPGPICNPGISAINAALNPAKTNYYFFVARGDGSHEFLMTFEEHKKAKAKYRKKML